MADFPGKGTVAVFKPAPDTMLDSIRRLMPSADIQPGLPKGPGTGTKDVFGGQVATPGMEIKTALRAAVRLIALAAAGPVMNPR